MKRMAGVEIFAVGTWLGSLGPIKWSLSDLEELVANTNALMTEGTLKPKLKLGHSSEQFWEESEILEGQDDGDPALGKAIQFRIQGDKVICDFESMPDIIYQCIEQELYDSVSAELSFIQNFGWFISAVSLLGADTPAVKVLDDLQAFLSDSSTSHSSGDFTLKFSQPTFKGDYKMPDEPIKTAAEEAIVKENATLKQQYSDSQSALQTEKENSEAKDKELAKYKQQAVTNRFSDEKQRVLQPFRDQVEKGRLMPAMLTKLEDCLDAQKAGFSEESVLTITPELTIELSEAYQQSMPGQEGAGGGAAGGDDGSAPDDKFELEVKKVQAQHAHMSYKQASDFVAMSQPVLLKEYSEWKDSVSNLGRVGGV